MGWKNFYHVLTPMTQDHLDAVAGGAFFSLNVNDAKALIKKMVSNKGWSDERLQPHRRGMHTVKEADMHAANVDLLMKRIEDCEKMSTQEVVQAMDARMTCEVYDETIHSRDSCPETQEYINFINNNNGYHPQQNKKCESTLQQPRR